MPSSPNYTPDFPFDLKAIRRQFPALGRKVRGVTPIYFDNPGGTQVPKSVIDTMGDYLIHSNSNTQGAFHTSQQTDRVIDAARVAMADLLNATSPREIVFGPNMTTLTFHISRSMARTLKAGDEIVITRMEHDGNAAPWLLVARDLGLTVRWANFDVETGLLDLDHMRKQITSKTKLVACVYASNALGTINDVKQVVDMAHAAGALAYIDAVQYAPHGPIDVQVLDCDFLVCSAYKFFGPHVGILYGKAAHLERFEPYKVRPASDEIPDRWETGTKNHEGLAGVVAAVDYLAWVGKSFGRPLGKLAKGYRGRRKALKQGLAAIKAYEQTLSQHLLDGLAAIQGVTVCGIAEREGLDQRVPTVIFNLKGKSPREVAAKLGKQGIYVWDGNYYALSVMEALGMEASGGMVRVGATHYNTHQEVTRFLAAVAEIARGK